MSKRAVEKIAMMTGLVLILALAGLSYVFYQRSNAVSVSSTPEAVSADVVERVSKLILLPTDETPTIATVSDPLSLKDQLFFAHAKAGDKVLIYTKAKKAILFSVSQGIVLEVAPLNLGGAPGIVTPGTVAEPKL